MSTTHSPQISEPVSSVLDDTTEWQSQESLLITRALQKAILSSANFFSIATDAKGVIQIFNVGAEKMLGYAAADVLNKITPADISDPLSRFAPPSSLAQMCAFDPLPSFVFSTV